MNHNTKTVESVFADLSELSIEEVVEEILKEQKHPKQVQTQEITLTPVLHRGKPSTQLIEGYVCIKYAAKYTLTYEKQVVEDTPEKSIYRLYKTFTDYFANSVLTFDFERNSPTHKPTRNFEIDVQAGSRKSTGAAITEKKYKATVWVCNSYPLKYTQFAPLIHVLSYTSQHIAKFAEFFSHNQLEGDGFPIKVRVPLFYTVNANLTLKNLKFENIASDFINVDTKYSTMRTCERIRHSPEVKLYSPISKTHIKLGGKNAQSFAEATGTNKIGSCKNDENDRLRWTSYESDENDESILRAQAQFESLLNNNPENNVEIREKPVKEEEAVVVQIVASREDSVDKKEEDSEDSGELDLDEGDDETTTRTAIDNIKAHSITDIKTLKDVAHRLNTEYKTPEKKPIITQSLEAKKKQKNEDNLKKLQIMQRKHSKHQNEVKVPAEQSPTMKSIPTKISHTQLRRGILNQGDSIQTLKKPFNGLSVKNVLSKTEKKGKEENKTMMVSNPRPIMYHGKKKGKESPKEVVKETKKVPYSEHSPTEDVKKIVQESDALKSMAKQSTITTRNVGDELRTYKDHKKYESVGFKKTIDVDIVLVKKAS